ncbi:hypothetical protein SGLAM104S_09363 [Streptomyces glaucescens]
MQDHRFGGLAEQVAVDLQVVLGARRGLRQGAGRRADRLGAGLLDDRELLLVGGADLGEGAGGELVGADAAGDAAADRLASAAERRISSAAPVQSRPMPRWAVSMASATPSPWDHRWRRKARVASQWTGGRGVGTSARGSATT